MPDENRPSRIPRLIAVVKGELPTGELDEDVFAVCDRMLDALPVEPKKTPPDALRLKAFSFR